MSSPGGNNPSDVIERMQVPDVDNVYVLGCLSRPLTFHSQQQRAFNLIWALFETGRLAPGGATAVVGGGLAGMTAAAAAVAKGSRVTLFEQSGDVLHLQWGNTTRYVHPNLYDWPEGVATQDETRLPCLNWTAGSVNDIVRQVSAQWKAGPKSKISLFQRTEIKTVKRQRDGIALTTKGRRLVGVYDCVILAVGFGIEHVPEGLPSRSYWRSDDLHQPIVNQPKPRRFLVSGCGDGGLIEVLRLRIDRFEHEFLHKMPALTNNEELHERLMATEKNAYALHAKARPQFLNEEYKRIYDSLRQDLIQERQLRSDTWVVLNGPANYPYQLSSSLLNRFAVFSLLAVDKDRLAYVPGKLRPASIQTTPDGYGVKLGSDGHLDVHQIVVRHGTKPALATFRSVYRQYRNFYYGRFAEKPDPTRHRLYKERWFGEIPVEWRMPRQDDWGVAILRMTPPPVNERLFVGRAARRARVKETLSVARVVTVKGFAGFGKTALAKQVAEDLAADYAGWVCWAELGSVQDKDALWPSIASAMGVREWGAETPKDAIIDVIGNKPLLLIMDNCEHVIPEASEIVRVLIGACAKLRILATSREGLESAAGNSSDCPAPSGCPFLSLRKRPSS